MQPRNWHSKSPECPCCPDLFFHILNETRLSRKMIQDLQQENDKVCLRHPIFHKQDSIQRPVEFCQEYRLKQFLLADSLQFELHKDSKASNR